MSDFNYPPQTGAYKVVVKSGAAWRDFDTARLEISVGQPYHEGAKFEATVDWASHRFSHVIISVNDTLQRFNLIFEQGLSENRAMVSARHAGSEWIRRQRPLLSRLPGCELSRWNEWLSHPGFATALEQTGTFYEHHQGFRDAVCANIGAVWGRKLRSSSAYKEADFPRFFDLSKQYILEETAVFSLMFQERPAVDIYPGTLLFMWNLFAQGSLPGAPEGLEKGRFTRIDFQRNKNPQRLADYQAAPPPPRLL
jgi:tRNA-dependent cyclodipeptide synthase